MSTAAGIVPVIVVAVGFVVGCIVDIVRTEPKVLPRWAWILICLASVPLGGVVYLLVGRGEREAPVSATGVQAGDSAAAGPGPSPGRQAAVEVRVESLTKVYGEHTALDAVSLDVPAGSVFGLVGPNGAGKTTLLATLAGLRAPTSGTVSFGVGPGGAAARVALLPDTPQFDAWLTAWEVVDLSRQLTDPDAPARRTDEVLAQAGLADAAGRRVGGFSRGMLQRLGVAATIVGDPDVLLLDEPCSALDPLGRREVLDFIGRLGGRHTVLFCSHILDDVQEVCDRVGVLRDGHLLFQGALGELLVGSAAPAYVVRVRPPASPVIEALAAQPWVTAVEQVGSEELRVTAASLADAERHLVPALAAAGAAVVSLAPVGADLERVFLELVR